MKRLNIIFVLLSCLFSVSAQDFSQILRSIEDNNLTLKSIQKQYEAQKLENHTGLAPENPEVGFNYLWGSPAAPGNRWDLNVTQSFDFPTAYVQRSKIADKQDYYADAQFRQERMMILYTAQQACIEMVYYNALLHQYEVNIRNAENLVDMCQKRFDAGDMGVVELNRSRLGLAELQNAYARVKAEQQMAALMLKQLNGDREITLSADSFLLAAPVKDFTSWYQQVEGKSPDLAYWSAQAEVDRLKVELNKSLRAPRFSVGYMSENNIGVDAEKFRGVTVGISLPLWAQNNTIKQAKAQASLTEMSLEDHKLQFRYQLERDYVKATILYESALALRQAFNQYNNAPLLLKAAAAGEISMEDYFTEMDFYYKSLETVLAAERDYALANAELMSVEL